MAHSGSVVRVSRPSSFLDISSPDVQKGGCTEGIEGLLLFSRSCSGFGSSLPNPAPPRGFVYPRILHLSMNAAQHEEGNEPEPRH